ncbi:MAG: C15orf41 family protein, partial [Candidatus Helarchaeota archaeon]|nr:C15orf41 family protein [Candidatus Helarchaeota archaeon]
FSPKGVQYSKRRGQTGEELIGEWMASVGIGCERDPGIGGPDFLLKTPLKLIFSGVEREFDWIESKASYADKFVLKNDSAQFDKYELYGNGLILYWFGIECETKYPIITWREMLNLVEASTNARIRSFIAFVPPEFRHLIS